jgi:GTP-binding protein HflX
VKSWRLRVKLVLPNHRTALVAELHRVGRVLDLSYRGDEIAITAHVPPQLQGKLRPYMVDDHELGARNGGGRPAAGKAAEPGS